MGSENNALVERDAKSSASDSRAFDSFNVDERVATHERLVSHLAVTPAGCWEFTGVRLKSGGYGALNAGGVKFRAHRLSWLIFRGAIADGLHVLHRCDNPPCCNPDHLFLGTNDDNIRDRNAKGRSNEEFRKQRLREVASSITHCPAGHPYSGDNLLFHVIASGRRSRRCRTCHAARERARNARKRGAA